MPPLRDMYPQSWVSRIGGTYHEAGALLFHGLFYHYFTTTLYTVILVFIYWYLPLPAKPNITKTRMSAGFSSIHAGFDFGAREGI